MGCLCLWLVYMRGSLGVLVYGSGIYALARFSVYCNSLSFSMQLVYVKKEVFSPDSRLCSLCVPEPEQREH
jgi:hypothetical protein